MALTPDEIRSRQFPLADRGYDRAEVQGFLASLADQLTAQLADRAQATGATPWSEAEERLLLILDAARRAVDTVRAEASAAIEAVRTAHGSRPAPIEAARTPNEVDGLRERLGAALREVESALGAIDAGDQRPASSTRPSS
jgi:DivIVA domain-containing protein